MRRHHTWGWGWGKGEFYTAGTVSAKALIWGQPLYMFPKLNGHEL